MTNLTKRPALGSHQLGDPVMAARRGTDLIKQGVGLWAEHRILEKALLHMKACHQKAMMM